MRNLKTTRSVKITYDRDKGGKNLTIKRYSDSDWAGDQVIRKLIFNFVFMLNRVHVNWYAKKKAIVTLSSIKAEYIALTLMSKEATWLRLLLIKLGLLKVSNKYVEIKVIPGSTGTEQILANIKGQKEEVIL